MQRALHTSLAQLDELILELRTKLQERPSTDELRSIEWSELDLARPGGKTKETGAPPVENQDALVDEDFEPDQHGVA